MYNSTWNPDSKAQLEKCIVAHGGWTAWEKLTEVSVKFSRFYGFLLFIKGLHRRFFTPNQIQVDTKSLEVHFKYDAHTDYYRNGQLMSGLSKQLYPEGRDLFSRKLFEQWSPLHALYFFGYALVNYMSYPFILAQFDLVDFKLSEKGSTFKIRFPVTWRTHSQLQTFYFNSQNLLFRHDYTARLVGPMVNAAHFTEDYERYKGVMIAKTRKVFPRFGRFFLRLPAIYANLDLID